MLPQGGGGEKFLDGQTDRQRTVRGEGDVHEIQSHKLVHGLHDLI